MHRCKWLQMTRCGTELSISLHSCFTGPQTLLFTLHLNSNIHHTHTLSHGFMYPRRDLGYLVAIAAVFKLGFCILLWRKTTTMQEPKPSQALPASARSLPAGAKDTIHSISTQMSVGRFK